jgi:hypothetical protein
MNAQEYEGIKQIIQKYNHVFIEADVLRYENRIFQAELLKAYREIVELHARLDEFQPEGSEDLSKIIPQVFEPKVTVEPLAPEIQLFTAFPAGDGGTEIILATQIESKEAVKVAKKTVRIRKPKDSSKVVPINKKRKVIGENPHGEIPF